MTRGTDLDIHIVYPGEGDADQVALNRWANLILIAVGAAILGLVAAFIAGVWA